ncbi:hypothetical protein GSI_04092 [Ganoderma sinense ZZ0214-1]|uniref:Uncharacterized protein n=1 Tax=Ganoderma sinense ZZ0214-1 TaxID=1077348 RepID=A0A2G8SI72_9APHY|nr:hypothetical protein GSI_04092 [Ganoderma sinense ZZ0214-1]
MVRTHFPLLSQYLWMKIDFVAMVREADGPEALAAAKMLAQEAKTYVVFTRSVAVPCFGGDPTSQYTVDIVTRGPRLVDDTEGFSSDMPNPPLPFPDCAHWLASTVDVAVQRVSEGLNNNKAHNLPPAQVYLINSANDQEWDRLIEERVRRLASGACLPQSSEDDPFLDSFVPLVDVGVDIAERFAGSDQLPTIYDYFEERAKIKRILITARDRAAGRECCAIASSSSTKQPSDSGTGSFKDSATQSKLIYQD